MSANIVFDFEDDKIEYGKNVIIPVKLDIDGEIVVKKIKFSIIYTNTFVKTGSFKIKANENWELVNLNENIEHISSTDGEIRLDIELNWSPENSDEDSIFDFDNVDIFSILFITIDNISGGIKANDPKMGINIVNIYLSDPYGNIYFVEDSYYEFDILSGNTTGIINQNNNYHTVKIFPNPAFEKINLMMNQSGFSEMKFYSITGKEVFPKIIYDFLNYKAEINLNDLSPGLYFIKILDIENNYYISETILIKPGK